MVVMKDSVFFLKKKWARRPRLPMSTGTGQPARPAGLYGCLTASVWLPHRGHVHGHGTARHRTEQAVRGKSGGTAGPDSHTDTHPRSLPRAAGDNRTQYAPGPRPQGPPGEAQRLHRGTSLGK